MIGYLVKYFLFVVLPSVIGGYKLGVNLHSGLYTDLVAIFDDKLDFMQNSLLYQLVNTRYFDFALIFGILILLILLTGGWLIGEKLIKRLKDVQKIDSYNDDKKRLPKFFLIVIVPSMVLGWIIGHKLAAIIHNDICYIFKDDMTEIINASFLSIFCGKYSFLLVLFCMVLLFFIVSLGWLVWGNAFKRLNRDLF